MEFKKHLLFTSIFCLLLVLINSCGHKHASMRSSANPEVAYFCPMDTLINEAKSGHCSVCGMNLIKNPNYSGVEMNAVVVTSTGDTLHK